MGNSDVNYMEALCRMLNGPVTGNSGTSCSLLSFSVIRPDLSLSRWLFISVLQTDAEES